MIDDHAQVFVGGMKLPLVGVSPEATKEHCDRCGRRLHLTRILLQFDGIFLCYHCVVFTARPGWRIELQLANSSPWRLNKMFGDHVR